MSEKDKNDEAERSRAMARLKIEQESFVEALRSVPSRSPERNRPLKDLVNRYRTALEHCEDDIPCDLSRFGIQRGMSYSDFIYEVSGA
jgi:hypothetical protein